MNENAPIHIAALIGWPVEHSLSPAMHNAALKSIALPGHYTLWPTPPHSLPAAVEKLRAEKLLGANITVPHKQAVMPYLDEITAVARAIGAVNTIVVRKGRLIGHNTDGDGFLASLREKGFEPARRRALLLGAGGAARAVAYALARNDCSVAIHNRTMERARELAAEMQAIGLKVQAIDSLSRLDTERIDLLINATPLGMWPQTDASPWPPAQSLPSRWAVYDLVYNPAETRLLAQARAAGAATIGGLGMLVHQGALAFELWTGKPAPVEIMRAAAEKSLKGGPPCSDS